MIVNICKIFEHDRTESKIIEQIETHAIVVDVSDQNAFNTLKADLEKCKEPHNNEENHQYSHVRTVLKSEHKFFEHIEEFEYEFYQHIRHSTRIHAYFTR